MVILLEESLKWLKWRNMTVSNNVVGMPKSLVITTCVLCHVEVRTYFIFYD